MSADTVLRTETLHIFKPQSSRFDPFFGSLSLQSRFQHRPAINSQEILLWCTTLNTVKCPRRCLNMETSCCSLNNIARSDYNARKAPVIDLFTDKFHFSLTQVELWTFGSLRDYCYLATRASCNTSRCFAKQLCSGFTYWSQLVKKKIANNHC